MINSSRAEKSLAFDHWAGTVRTEDLIELDTSDLKRLAQLSHRRTATEAELQTAVLDARRLGRTWSEIGAMLGVSKQAAQRKHAQVHLKASDERKESA